MKALLKEFKDFINRGNVIDLAVAVIVGGAFTGVVTALTTNIINPLISFVSGGNTGVSGLVVPGTEIDFGAFISAIINFLIVAFVVFILVKAVNKAQSVADKFKKEEELQEEEKAPTCPFCLEEIKEGATRCPHCTAVLSETSLPGKANPAEGGN